MHVFKVFSKLCFAQYGLEQLFMISSEWAEHENILEFSRTPWKSIIKWNDFSLEPNLFSRECLKNQSLDNGGINKMCTNMRWKLFKNGSHLDKKDAYFFKLQMAITFELLNRFWKTKHLWARFTEHYKDITLKLYFIILQKLSDLPTNILWMVFVWTSTKVMFFVSIGNLRWPPRADNMFR